MKSKSITIFPGVVLYDPAIDKYLGRSRGFKGSTNFKFGNSKIFSYRLMKSRKVRLNKWAREAVEDLYLKIKDSENNSLKDFTVIVSEKDDSFSLKNNEAEEILSFLAYKDGLSYWISMDRVKSFSFDRLETYINNKRTFWDARTVYTLPHTEESVGTLFIGKDNLTLLNVLEATATHDPKLYERIIRAVRLYNSALKVNSDNQEASIVLLASALEALFDLPISSLKKSSFVYAAKLHLGLREEIELWAEEFYELRNTIVHGSEVKKEHLMLSGKYRKGMKLKKKEKTLHYAHFEIAKTVFEECMFLQLEAVGYLKVKHKAKEEIIKGIVNRIRPNRAKFGYLLHKKFNYKAFKSDIELYESFLRIIDAVTPTDYSAEDKYLSLVKKICDIALDWIKEENLEHIGEGKEGELAEHYTFYRETIGKIKKQIKLLNSSKTMFEFEDRKRKLQELVTSIDRVVRNIDDLRFHLPEFLDLAIRPLWGTYLRTKILRKPI